MTVHPVKSQPYHVAGKIPMPILYILNPTYISVAGKIDMGLSIYIVSHVAGKIDSWDSHEFYHVATEKDVHGIHRVP